MNAVGSDLNPVAVLITKALIEIPPKFANKPPVNPDADPMGMTVGKGRKTQKLPWRGASGLADDIRYYGRWMREEAFKRIGHLYPTVKDDNGIDRTVIAWLWARTVPCPNPACNVKMPMIKSFQLSKKSNNRHWTKPVVDRETNTISFHVQNHDVGVPKEGTRIGNGGVCIACGSAFRLDYVREQGKSDRMDAQMTAIVADGEGKRLFLSPRDTDIQATSSIELDWKPMGNLPEQARSISVQLYGFTEWHKLFTDRQLKALTTFSDLLKDVRNRLEHDGSTSEYIDALCTYLALAIDRSADSSSSFSTWQNGRDTVGHVFGRQGIGMIWDFAEPNPFSKKTQNWMAQIEWIAKVVDCLPAESNRGKGLQADASTTVHANNAPVIVTDPPYYDNIHYADSSDFFYVWLRRQLRDQYPELFAGILTPKEEEIVANRFRHSNASEWFENQLSSTLKLIRRSCSSEFPTSIFYAYKQQKEERGRHTSTGWETMLNAVLESGFQIIGTWPIQTALANRQNSLEANSLISAIILVCRPRPEDAKSASRQQFLSELADQMPSALDHLTRSSHIAPTELAQSAIGPGMEIYSKYSSVAAITGQLVTVRDALVAINLEIQKYDERETGVLDAESQFCVTWLKQHGFDQGDYGVAETLSKAKNIDVDDLADFHDVLTATGGKVQLHSIDYYAPVDYDYELPIDDRGGKMTAWEACFRVAYHMDNGRREDAGGVFGAAYVVNTKGGDIESIERLARILYNYHDARGEAHDAYLFNSIVTNWTEIYIKAHQFRSSRQERLG